VDTFGLTILNARLRLEDNGKIALTLLSDASQRTRSASYSHSRFGDLRSRAAFSVFSCRLWNHPGHSGSLRRDR